MARKLAALLTVADIARLRRESGMTRGLSRSAVWSWLRKLDKRSGGRLLVSRRPLATTLSLIMRFDPRWLEEGRVSRDDVAFLKRKLCEQDKRVSALGARVRDLQRVVDAIASRVERLAG